MKRDRKVSTNTNAINSKVREYIYDCINLEDYEIERGKPLILEVYEIFKSEKDWEIEREGERRAFKNWIMGLPSCLNIDFVTYEQRQLLKEWFKQSEEENNRYESHEIAQLFYQRISNQFFDLIRIAKNNIEKGDK